MAMSNAQASDTNIKPAHCPSCGRFVGPYARCPYCGARIQGRISLHAIKIAALLCAIAGLLALWWLAYHTPIPELTAAEIQGTMNLAYVQLTGQVSRSPTYDPESHYLAFWLDDGTGEVYVSAYRDVTQALLDTERVPAPGDKVHVAGTLRVRDDFASLTLNTPEHLTLTRPRPVTAKLASLTVLDKGLRLRTSGVIEEIRTPYEGLTLLTVQNETGQITVAVDETLTTLTGPLPEVEEGQAIQITGTVNTYKGNPQLIPASVSDIQLSDVPSRDIQSVAQLSDITPDMAGAWLRARGHIVALDGIKGGLKATLDDGTDQITVLLWLSLYQKLPNPTAFDIGADAEVVGDVQIYNGELEIVPDAASDITLHTPAPAPPWVEVTELTHKDAGRVVRIRGVLNHPEGFSAGVKVPLDDGTGKITVLIWANLVEDLNPPLEAGQMLEVIGQVEVYRGQLELIPRSPLDWRAAP